LERVREQRTRSLVVSACRGEDAEVDHSRGDFGVRLPEDFALDAERLLPQSLRLVIVAKAVVERGEVVRVDRDFVMTRPE
jgi:hypothetical protein